MHYLLLTAAIFVGMVSGFGFSFLSKPERTFLTWGRLAQAVVLAIFVTFTVVSHGDRVATMAFGTCTGIMIGVIAFAFLEARRLRRTEMNIGMAPTAVDAAYIPASAFLDVRV